MSRKKIETIIRQAMAPFTLSQTGKAKVSQLVRTYPYELLVECIDIGIANYLTYEQDGTPSKESVELFIDKLGGIAYNKSQSSVNQGIIYVKNYCKKIYTYWNDNRATTLLNAYVVALRNAGWNEKLIESDLKTDMIFLCKRTTNWTCWYQAVEQWIEDINNWKNNCIKENGSVLPQSLIERINYTNVKLLCKQINASYVEAKNISPYLIDFPNVLVEKRLNPLCDVPKMIAGNKGVKCLPLYLEKEEKELLIKKEPEASKYIKKMVGSAEFINNIERYCLWLVDCSPAELRKMPEVMKRVEATRQERMSSTDKQAQVLADKPMLFRDTNNPETAIIVPLVSSERRRYIPMGYIDKSIIANNKVSMIPNGTLYEFGILMSNVHNAWMRTVSMRMKSDYSYSLAIVYNNFPWPEPTEEQRKTIETTAQAILDIRNKYPESSLADLYDSLTMPYELLQAHRENDKTVMQAYGFSTNMTESECVAELFKLYQQKVK